MRALFLTVTLLAAVSASAMSWPPGEDQAGHDDVDPKEMRAVWDRFDAASEEILGKSGDLDVIRKIKLPHAANLIDIRWISSRTVLAQATASFAEGRTSVTYFVVFEKKWFTWRLRSYYTATIACQG
jgi:hypothetical protein